MSVTEYTKEPDPVMWERYLSECRAASEELNEKVIPSLSDYDVWLVEQGYDEIEI